MGRAPGKELTYHLAKSNDFGVVYTDSTLQEMLLGQEVHACQTDVWETQVLRVETLFEQRKAWQMSSVYMQVTHQMFWLSVLTRVKKGMSAKMAALVAGECDGLYIANFIYEGSCNDDSGDESKMCQLQAELRWNTALAAALRTIKDTEEFSAAESRICLVHMNRANYMPRPVHDEDDVYFVVKLAISLFAALRIYRDKITAKQAFRLVMQCKGIDAVLFFG